MRLQKYMAECGVASRRKCEEMIAQGRVMVNGQQIVRQGVQVDPEKDQVKVDGTLLHLQKRLVYIMLNKPKGVVTTVSDQFGRKNVTDLVEYHDRIFPVGRLDYDTEGLLLLTNDGNFAYQMTHPGRQVDKCYQAFVRGIPGEKALEQLRRGVMLDGRNTAPAKAELIGTNGENGWVELVIHEGRNRQVRRMLETVGFPVLRLRRISVGGVGLGALPSGKWRFLTEEELTLLLQAVIQP